MDITTKTKWTDEEIVDHIVYACADEYSWYQELSHDEETGKIRIVMDDPDFDDRNVCVEVTCDDIRAMISRIINEDLPGEYYVNTAVVDRDFDAPASDIVCQYLVFGELIYG